jgi:hypothetical protein
MTTTTTSHRVGRLRPLARTDESRRAWPEQPETRGLHRTATPTAYGLVVLVAAMTAAAHAGFVSVNTLAASPERFAQGRVWLLVSNGVLVQRPLLLSLISFALLSLFTLYLCGPRIYVASTVVGHVGATLLAYAVVAAAFALDRGAIRSVLNMPDYGVSAIQASWIGAIAATSWRRHGQTLRGRVLIVLACLAVTAFAWMLRSDLTLLDLDHLFAFVIGASFAAARASRHTPPLPQTVHTLARLTEAQITRLLAPVRQRLARTETAKAFD